MGAMAGPSMVQVHSRGPLPPSPARALSPVRRKAAPQGSKSSCAAPETERSGDPARTQGMPHELQELLQAQGGEAPRGASAEAAAALPTWRLEPSEVGRMGGKVASRPPPPPPRAPRAPQESRQSIK